MQKAIVNRIRPASWKVCVQGKEEAEHVRGVLAAIKLESTECKQERDLTDPPVYSFVVSSQVDAPLTSAELQSFLEADEQTEVTFDAFESV
jgi:hypothetical protein